MSDAGGINVASCVRYGTEIETDTADANGRDPYTRFHAVMPSETVEQEAIIVAFRKRVLLPLDDCLHALQTTLPKLARSSLHRRLERQVSAVCPKERSPI